jgi:monoamine oxidase
MLASGAMETDVCVIGAGYAGLTAARRLIQGGSEALVLEARDRVGGRVWTTSSEGGIPIDLGGTFVGPMQDRMHALVKEMGAELHRTYVGGDSILATGGQLQRYTGDVPRINPVALASAGQAIYRLEAMAKRVPVDAPWDAPRARAWDSHTVASWMTSARVPTRAARDLIATTVRALFCCDTTEVSLLDLLYLVRSAGGLTPLMTIEGGYQHEQVVGGAQSIAQSMADELGSSVVLNAPVHSVRHGSGAIEVRGDDVVVTARSLVVAIPPALAGHIRFDPPLPGDRALLLHSMPAGTEIKTVAVYDEPFWRADGVSGASAAMDAAIEVTLDTSPPTGEVGVLAGYCSGPKARVLARMPKAERRQATIDMLATRFGAKARAPIEYLDVNWWDEEWTRGCSMAHFPPGVLTQYGRLLREPIGRIHWAGTETSGPCHGTIDGAVRSGERAAAEVLSTTA